MNSDKPTLKHQRNWKQQMEDSKQWYDRGVKTFQATKYRKGACEKWVLGVGASSRKAEVVLCEGFQLGFCC